MDTALKTARQLAEKYMPCFYVDEKEPFTLDVVGYKIYQENGRSDSFPRDIKIDKSKVDFMVEYELYFDFDIGHLFDLEHAFVYVGYDGTVVDVEASYHGGWRKAMINGDLKFFEETHPILYLQPGKHAVMCDPKYFYVNFRLIASCADRPGSQGYLRKIDFDMLPEKTDENDKAVREYLKQFAFTPSLHYVSRGVQTEVLAPHDDFREIICGRIEKRLTEIMGRPVVRKQKQPVDMEIAKKYLPHFRAEINEPFPITVIGAEIHHETYHSADYSFNREIPVDKSKVDYIIEYMIFFDFDIQHLWDLENVLVAVGYNGEIVEVGTSFHGTPTRAMINGDLKFENETHPVVYLQPGKHAIMPDPKYFELYGEYDAACNELAGADGFLRKTAYSHRFPKDAYLDEKVRNYIKDHYAFTPTKEYKPLESQEDKLVPYYDFFEKTCERTQYWLDIINK